VTQWQTTSLASARPGVQISWPQKSMA
jgi:hypothetical protein